MVYFDVFELGAIESARPSWNYFNITDNIIPKLLKAGVSPKQIDIMTSDNPRRIFENVGRY
jgi:predicted metal-dependent phosphotriesterase family hydrolase